ncbi:MAG: hypothetical protein H6718_35555 [Polyangiaceae bacterium]|nr:hypothetical protein [Polyangiaceae bacterium]MCB9610390.1 hypothetical protein [Polyangiaceae bacterium]
MAEVSLGRFASARRCVPECARSGEFTVGKQLLDPHCPPFDAQRRVVAKLDVPQFDRRPRWAFRSVLAIGRNGSFWG